MRLREKDDKRHEMPCHQTLDDYLHAHLDGCGLASDAKGPLFRTIGDPRFSFGCNESPALI